MTAPHTYVIAEAGVNHDGSVEEALRLIDVAADAGSDCVKFQTFRAGALASARAEKAAYQKETTSSAESQRTMLERLELSHAAHLLLVARAADRGIDFLSTPFDHASLQFLVCDLKLARIKVGSGDLTNAPLLLEMAKSGCAVILSTGMCTLEEVEEALSVLAYGYAGGAEPSRAAFAAARQDKAAWAKLTEKVVLLHCTTEYPTPPECVNLRAMETLSAAFALPVGYSDHTLGIDVSVAAVARGALMLEKHLTLDRSRPGPDHAASLEPGEFKRMVEAVRIVEQSLGDGRKQPQAAEMKNIVIARKALVAARPIDKGEVFSIENVTAKRPARGLPPIALWDLVGQRARRSYAADEAIES